MIRPPPLNGIFSVLCQRIRQNSRETNRTMGRNRSSAHSGSIRAYGRAPLRCGASSMLVLMLKSNSRRHSGTNVPEKSVSGMKTFIGSDQARTQVILAGSTDRYSIFRTLNSQSHGTQWLPISSNRSRSCRHNSGTSNAVQFPPVEARAEN